jgi:hypothetical protein
MHGERTSDEALTYDEVAGMLSEVTALGKAGYLTDDTKRLLGRDPLTFRQFAQDFAEVWASVRIETVS